MVKKRREKLNRMFGPTNVKRCLFAALLSVSAFPVLLILSLLEPEFAKEYMIPMAFFSAGSGAFAFLLFQVKKNKAKQYYEVVTWAYLTAFHLFFVYMAQADFVFYYIVVVLAAYMVLLPLDRYIIMTVGELVCFAAIYVKGGAQELPLNQLLLLAGVHLFSFMISRDLYYTKKKFIIEEKRLQKETKAAEHDPLTGLYNRRGMERRVAEMWQRGIHHQEMLAAFIVDIDFFKTYNDKFGHVQGDKCIQKIADTIADTVAQRGICARTGGEEFMIFAQGTNPQELYDLAEQIRYNVEQLSIVSAAGTAVTVSIGADIRCASADASLQGLYGRADKALYRAKQEGRNCVRSAHTRKEHRTKIG